MPVEEIPIVTQVVSQLPWGNNILSLQKFNDNSLRIRYAQKAIQNGWSRAALDHQIDSGLYERQEKGEKATNFEVTLPKPDSDLARQILKDPYNFDFLTLGDDFKEREIERGLIAHLQKKFPRSAKVC
jgi:predicted nuclease of restriction endonuclease-like (RecB) superfamily